MASVYKPRLPTSIWLTNAGVKSPKGPERTFPVLDNVRDKHYDAVIVGGGIFGVSTAWRLKQAGMRVALLEGRTIGTGTTGFSTAKLSAQQGPLYSTITQKRGKKAARDYYDINMDGIRIAERLRNELGLECEMERRPHVTWTGDPDNVSAIESELQACRDLGIPHRALDAAELLRELPATLSPQRGVAFDDMLQFNAFEYCVELARRVDGDGSVVYEDSRVTSVTENVLAAVSSAKKNHDIVLEENGSLLTSDYVVLATHLPIMDQSLHFAILEPSRSHCIAVRVKRGSSAMRMMSVNADQPMRSMRTDKDNDVIIISGEKVPMGEKSDTDECYQKLEQWARQHFEVDETVCRWSAMDYAATDHVPYLGYLHLGTKTAFMASGFSKWGLAFSIGGAEIINDLIHGKSNRLYDTVSAQRGDFVNQAQALISEGGHTASHLVGDKIKQALTLTSVGSLEKGQGAICKSGLKTVGAFRDEDGVVHAVDPVCTHLGCNVVFNQGDCVWDCPCHGSQFGVDGEVIHGPATKPLCKVSDIDW